MNAATRISNPKRNKRFASQKDAWFDYYAGFSARFVSDAIREIQLPPSSLILDPWNGSGTTTATAHSLGLRSLGFDINPVMVVVARAKLLQRGVHESLLPLADDLLDRAANRLRTRPPADPLTAWFVPSAAAVVRSIADAISHVLTKQECSRQLYTSTGLSGISDLAAFYFVALFRTVRHLLEPFRATNPTWLKMPITPRHRLRSSDELIRSSFRRVVAVMADAVTDGDAAPPSEIRLGSSSALPHTMDRVDAVISSPPYCTRIDYAVATKAELAVLGCPLGTEFTELRRQLIGGPVVNGTQPQPTAAWGVACHDLLTQVRDHPSKGSANYYHKLFLQYFGQMYSSLKEIDRVTHSGGHCVLVVQDSHYKSVHIDLARILAEMTSSLGWSLHQRFDFRTAMLMARMNPRSRKYRNHQSALESVLWFEVA